MVVADLLLRIDYQCAVQLHHVGVAVARKLVTCPVTTNHDVFGHGGSGLSSLDICFDRNRAGDLDSERILRPLSPARIVRPVMKRFNQASPAKLANSRLDFCAFADFEW